MGSIRQFTLATRLVLCLLAGTAAAGPAQARTFNQGAGTLSANCAVDLEGLPCTNGVVRRALPGFFGGPGSAFDSLDSSYTGLDGSTHFQRTLWSVGAHAGSVKAGASTSLILPKESPLFGSEGATAAAFAVAGDDLTILGATDVARRVTLHFSLGGQVADEAGVLLPFGRTYGGNSQAIGSLGVTVDATAGTNRNSPVVLDAPGGLLERRLGDTKGSFQSLSLSFDVFGGNVLSTLLNLEVRAAGSGTANFLGTGKLDYIEAPADVSVFSAGSGEALVRLGDRLVYTPSNVPDPLPIPEPATAWLWLAGLAGLGWLRQQRGGAL